MQKMNTCPHDTEAQKGLYGFYQAFTSSMMYPYLYYLQYLSSSMTLTLNQIDGIVLSYLKYIISLVNSVSTNYMNQNYADYLNSRFNGIQLVRN